MKVTLNIKAINFWISFEKETSVICNFCMNKEIVKVYEMAGCEGVSLKDKTHGN